MGVGVCVVWCAGSWVTRLLMLGWLYSNMHVCFGGQPKSLCFM